MVAEVIKLPSTTTNSLQQIRVGGSVGIINSPAGTLFDTAKQTTKSIKQVEARIEDVRKAANNLNDFAKQIQTSLQFSVDESSGRSVITVTDSQTGDVIRQIPAKEVLAVANLLREFVTSDVDKVGLLLADQG